MIAPPGAGKTLFARNLVADPTVVLRALKCEADGRYLTQLAGLPHVAIGNVPFRAPHFTVSRQGMMGTLTRGYLVRPGELSLAHGGILYLDSPIEFDPAIIEEVIQAAHNKMVFLSDGVSNVTLPADFRLVVSSQACPCGHHGTDKCHCPDSAVTKYADHNKVWEAICEKVDPASV